MPQAAKRPCGHVGCAALVERGERYCDEHKSTETKQRERWRGSASSRGYDAAHRRLRAQVMKESRYLCQRCLSLGRATPATDLHHIKKVATHPELRLDRDNVIAVCRDCHEVLERTSI